MKNYQYVTLREMPEIKEQAAEWFHSKWGVPKIPSSSTAVSYGCRQVDEYLDEENEITRVFGITREEWRSFFDGIYQCSQTPMKESKEVI